MFHSSSSAALLLNAVLIRRYLCYDTVDFYTYCSMLSPYLVFMQCVQPCMKWTLPCILHRTRTVDFAPHHSHWNRFKRGNSLQLCGWEEWLQTPLNLSMHTLVMFEDTLGKKDSHRKTGYSLLKGRHPLFLQEQLNHETLVFAVHWFYLFHLKWKHAE